MALLTLTIDPELGEIVALPSEISLLVPVRSINKIGVDGCICMALMVKHEGHAERFRKEHGEYTG